MHLPQISFARSEIGMRAGLDDDTLSYWIRAGLIAAENGGGGKGRHLHFSRLELGLAVLLSRLRALGLSSTALSPLAERFHAADVWRRAHGLDVPQVGQVHKLVQARSKLLSSNLTKPENVSELWKAFLERKAGHSLFDLPDEAITLAETVSVEQWNLHQSFFDTLVTIALKRPSTRDTYVWLSRSSNGKWHISPHGQVADSIQLNVKSLGQQVWKGDE